MLKTPLTWLLAVAASCLAVPSLAADNNEAVRKLLDKTPDCGGEYQKKCEFAPAISKGKAAKLGCKKGFFDPRKGGECWSCPKGYKRTWDPVTSKTACATSLFGKKSKATFEGTVWGCGRGEFFDIVDKGSCWTCPQYYNRSIHHVKGATACTIKAKMTCDPGNALKDAFRKQCTYSEKAQLEVQAQAKLAELAKQILIAANLAQKVEADPALRSQLKDKSGSAESQLRQLEGYSAAQVYQQQGLQTITVGVTVGAQVLFIGGSAETGVSTALDGERPVYWYGSAAYKWGPGANAGGGVNVGLWVKENNDIAGDGHGYSFDIGDAIAAYKLLEGVADVKDVFNLKPGVSIGVGMWFEYSGQFSGFTVTIGAGVGVDFSGYSRTGTAQIK